MLPVGVLGFSCWWGVWGDGCGDGGRGGERDGRAGEGRDGPTPPRPWEAFGVSLGMSLSDILGSLDRSKASK